MIQTAHIQTRMAQRNFSNIMIEAIINLGESSSCGDQVSLNKRQQSELNELIQDTRRKQKELKKALKDLERLKQKQRPVVVLSGETLITVYDNYN